MKQNNFTELFDHSFRIICSKNGAPAPRFFPGFSHESKIVSSDPKNDDWGAHLSGNTTGKHTTAVRTVDLASFVKTLPKAFPIENPGNSGKSSFGVWGAIFDCKKFRK